MLVETVDRCANHHRDRRSRLLRGSPNYFANKCVIFAFRQASSSSVNSAKESSSYGPARCWWWTKQADWVLLLWQPRSVQMFTTINDCASIANYKNNNYSRCCCRCCRPFWWLCGLLRSDERSWSALRHVVDRRLQAAAGRSCLTLVVEIAHEHKRKQKIDPSRLRFGRTRCGNACSITGLF